MKHFFIVLFLFCVARFSSAQSVSIDSVSPLKSCAGKSISVFYSSSVPFDSLNIFQAQVQDSSGIFTNFSLLRHQKTVSAPVLLSLNKPGKYVLALAFYYLGGQRYADTTPVIEVFANPTPHPLPNLRKTNYFGYTGVAGDDIEFRDTTSEPSGSTYLWKFDQDGNVVKFLNSLPIVTYPAAGSKTGSLSVANSSGCSATANFNLSIISCKPVIPATAHIVAGTETVHSGYRFILVKTGGICTVDTSHTIFVESGGTLKLGNFSGGALYLKPGATVNFAAPRLSPSTAILSQGATMTLDTNFRLDTIYCDNLQFDYSLVGGANDVAIEEKNTLQIFTPPNSLRASCEGTEISASVISLLGITMLSKRERDILDLDLSALGSGVYVAIIESGNHREMRKIVVMH